MKNLMEAVAAKMPEWAYYDRAPRDKAAPYCVYVIDTIGVDDTGSLLHSTQITVDCYARDGATSAASQLADMAATLDAALVRAHITASDMTGSSSLVTLGGRQFYRDPEDDGMSVCRSVYTTTWSTT